MKIHEYQAKALLKARKVPVPDGDTAFSVEDALKIAGSFKKMPVVVKAQIHAGGRGKGGGVKLASTNEEVELFAGQILGMNLVTHQTGPYGQKVGKLLIEEGFDIKREMYLGIVSDRSTAEVVVMASQAGGMDIEEVAEKTPEKIFRACINPLSGIQSFHARQIAYSMDLPSEAIRPFTDIVTKLYNLFIELDCTLVEINPLILTDTNSLVALDAKIDFDDNALYRHPEIKALRDKTEEAPLEVEASEYNLNYISLDGNIGNIVNGAGLAMATMDLIKLAGGSPANFLDVGGGATSEMVENAFRILLKDENVKGILINIFGGILRCDVFAEGVVRAAKNTGLNIPVVVRMEGTNVEKGRKILAESGLSLETARDLKDAAQKISEIIKQ